MTAARRPALSAVVLALMLHLIPGGAIGQEWRWRSGGPSGAPVRDVLVDPARPGHLWAVTLSSGVFETEDDGLTWREVGQGLRNPWGAYRVTCLTTDRNNERLLAGTRLSGLFTSRDGGRTWNSSETGFDVSVETVTVIDIDPRDSRTLLVGTNAGLFSSEDGGDSFRRVRLPGTDAVPGKVLALERHPGDPTRLFVSIDQAGLFASTDGGLTWKPAGDGLIGAPACLAFDLENLSTLWASGPGGLHRWEGTAGRWVPVGSGLPRDIDVRSLLHVPGPNGGLFAGTRLGRLFRSLDRGDNWERLASAPAQPGPVSIRVRPGGGLYLAGGGGLFVSLDQGATWNAIDGDLRSAPIRSVSLMNDRFGHLVAATGIGAFRSEDFGDSWRRSNAGLKSPQFSMNRVISDLRNPSRLLAATEDGLVLSDDAGDTWRSTPLSGWITDVVSLPGGPGTLLATVLVADETVVYASSDDGAAWTERLRTTRDPSAWLTVTTAGDLFLFAKGLHRSADGGRTWDAVPHPGGVTNFTSVKDVGFGSGRLLAGTDNGLLQSADRGATWSRFGLDGKRIIAFELHRIDPDWLAALCDDGLRLSLDGGDTWSDISLAGVPAPHTDVAIDPSRDFLYLVAENAVYTATIPRRTKVAPPERIKASPNPFATSTRIQFELHERGQGDVTLFTVHGDLVRQFVFAETPPGHHDILWDGLNDDGERVPNGMYIVVVRTQHETVRGKLIKAG
jgi:photosystem II stability/assembly factor-like uncharacterized protein